MAKCPICKKEYTFVEGKTKGYKGYDVCDKCSKKEGWINKVKEIKEKVEKGVIPMWLVGIGYCLFGFTGIVFIIIRNSQIKKNKKKYNLL